MKECWHFKSAKVCTKYRIGTSTPMDKADRFTEVSVLNCYRETGYVYLENIPRHLQEEWKALVKERAIKRKTGVTSPKNITICKAKE